MRDHNFSSADEQGNKAHGGDPVSNADEGGVPRGIGRGGDVRGRNGHESSRRRWCGCQIRHASWSPAWAPTCFPKGSVPILPCWWITQSNSRLPGVGSREAILTSRRDVPAARLRSRELSPAFSTKTFSRRSRTVYHGS